MKNLSVFFLQEKSIASNFTGNFFENQTTVSISPNFFYSFNHIELKDGKCTINLEAMIYLLLFEFSKDFPWTDWAFQMATEKRKRVSSFISWVLINLTNVAKIPLQQMRKNKTDIHKNMFRCMISINYILGTIVWKFKLQSLSSCEKQTPLNRFTKMRWLRWQFAYGGFLRKNRSVNKIKYF